MKRLIQNLCHVSYYFWKVSLVAPVFKNSWEMSTVESCCPVSLLSVLSKIFEKLVNNRIVDHQQKCDLFSDFQYGFRFSQSTAELQTVVSHRIARAFNRSVGLLELQHLINPRLLTGLVMLVFFKNLSLLWSFMSGIWPYFFFSQ